MKDLFKQIDRFYKLAQQASYVSEANRNTIYTYLSQIKPYLDRFLSSWIKIDRDYFDKYYEFGHADPVFQVVENSANVLKSTIDKALVEFAPGKKQTFEQIQLLAGQLAEADGALGDGEEQYDENPATRVHELTSREPLKKIRRDVSILSDALKKIYNLK